MRRHALLIVAVAILGSAFHSQAAEKKSLVGVNAEWLKFYSPACSTIDAIKSSQRFGSFKNPADGAAPVDANGWPTTDFGVVVAAHVPGIEGVYKLSCEGKAEIFGKWVKTFVSNVKFDGKITTADVEFRGGGLFELTFSGTADGVRNLKLLRPGYTSDEQVFTNEYLKSKEPFGAVRLMDWSMTNDSTVAKWDDRCKMTDAQWSVKGGPWEPWLDYAAKHGKDLWLCVPHQADEDYIRNLAKLCKERIGDAAVNLYLEDTNEYWNRLFGQSKWIDTQARQNADEWKLREPRGGDLRHRYHARRTVEIGRIFREIFGVTDYRIRPILTGNLADARGTEDGVEWIETHFGPAKQHIFGVACAPYFGNNAAVASRQDISPKEIADHLMATAKRYSTPESKTAAGVRQFHGLAKSKGIRSMAYEGGVDLGSPGAGVRGKALDAYIDARTASQLLPETGAAVTEYLDWWFKSGGQEFFYFKDFSIYSKSGYWGLSNHPNKLDTPKYQAAAEVAKKYGSE
jgi:hypothetical protein